jgi:hypothetical protein
MSWRRIGEWICRSTVLELSTRWRWMVSFMPQSLYPLRKSPRYPFDRRLGRPQSRFGRCREEKILPLPAVESGQSSPSLYRLSYPGPLVNIRLKVKLFLCLIKHQAAEWDGLAVTLWTRIRKVVCSNLVWNNMYPEWSFCVFPPHLEVNVGTLRYIKPRPLPST